MLQSMRHLAQNIVFKALMMILVISFAIWGIGDIFRGNPMNERVAKAGRAAITVQALNQNFEQDMARARGMLGSDFSLEKARQMGMLEQSLNGMIERAEIDQAAKKFGLDVAPEAVVQLVAEEAGLKDKSGKINKELFKRVLEQARMKERDFLEQGRQDMAREQLVNAFRLQMKAPQTVADTIYKARGQKRVLDVITIKNDSFKDIPAPEDKALRDFYQQNEKLFTAPEYRALTIAQLSVSDVSKEIAISDEDLKKAYEAKTAELTQPERRDLEQVVVQTEDKAKKLAADARASGNLASTSKSAGYDAVPLPGTEEKTLLPELAPTVFKMKSGAVSDPIQSGLGWHVVQVKKISPSGKPAFADIKNKLRDDMQRDQAIESATRMVNKLDDELAAGHSLEDIADGMKMRLIKIPSINAAGKPAEGKEPAELPNKAETLQVAFAQGSGEISPIMDDKKGHYIVVRTDEITPSGLQPFEKVKDNVLAAWKLDQQAKRAVTEAEKIAAGLKDGKSASSFSGSGIDVRVSKPISLLGDKDTSLPTSVLPQIFKMKKGEVSVSNQGTEQIVLRLVSINDAGTPDTTVKNQLAGEIGQETQKELFEQYMKHLQVVFPVKIDHEVLENMKQRGS